MFSILYAFAAGLSKKLNALHVKPIQLEKQPERTRRREARRIAFERRQPNRVQGAAAPANGDNQESSGVESGLELDSDQNRPGKSKV